VWWRKPYGALDGHGTLMVDPFPERTVWETAPTKRVLKITNWSTQKAFVRILRMNAYYKLTAGEDLNSIGIIEHSLLERRRTP
jgi:hypothetical protein